MEDQQQPQPSATVLQQAAPTKDDMNMGMLCHLLGIFTGFLGPLVLWLVKKEESEFVDDQGKEALNFQIFLVIVYLVASLPICAISFLTCGVGSLLIFGIIIPSYVFMIIACIDASKGVRYRYPVTWRIK